MTSGVHMVTSDTQGVMALYKPCGIMSMPNHPGRGRHALFDLEYDSEKRCYQSDHKKFFLLNRLDTPTSGIVLGCDSLPVAQAVRQAFASGNVQKEYRALVRYRSMPEKGVFRDCLQKQHFGDYVRSRHVTSQGVSAVTRYTFVQNVFVDDTMLAIYQLQPVTGRTHQLRVQCARRQMPIIGDQTYGDFKLNRQLAPILGKRLYLQACGITLRYRYKGRVFEFSAHVPYEF